MPTLGPDSRGAPVASSSQTAMLPDLLVSEMFVSLQGEGASVGCPASFLRLGRCNLACSFCDTPYTWDFSRYSFDEEIQSRSDDALIAWLTATCPGRLIVTGGEPLIQQKPLARLLLRLKQQGRLPVVEVETNGTIRPRKELAACVSQWNVSVKLANSGEARDRRLKPEALSWFADRPNAYFKFVLSQVADGEEALKIAQAYGVPQDRVIFMPEARDPVELERAAPAVAGQALAAGVRFTTRLHLQLYGARRGV